MQLLSLEVTAKRQHVALTRCKTRLVSTMCPFKETFHFWFIWGDRFLLLKKKKKKIFVHLWRLLVMSLTSCEVFHPSFHSANCV